MNSQQPFSSTTLRHPDHGADAGTRPSAGAFWRKGDGFWRLPLAIFAGIAVVALYLGFIWADSHRLAPCEQVIRECGFEEP